MKKLILSISLMMTSVSFGQDALLVFNTLVDVAGQGDKLPAIEYFKMTTVPATPIDSNEYQNKYKWDITECRISNDGVMILLGSKEKFEEVKEFISDIIETKPEVASSEGLTTYLYDYIQLGDASKNKDFTDAGIKYYIFSPYLEKKE
jgi:hypothetical protein